MALLKVNELTRKFRKNGELFTAVDHVSFTIEEGECLGIVGESGCGKSTTANIIARLQKEDSGDIIFQDRKINGGMLTRPIGRELQMIFQNPQDSFDPRDTVLEGIMQGAVSYHMYSKKELREKALDLFSYVGLKAEYQNRKTAELSGGEGQELLILVTELTISCYGARFISRYGCKEYFAHNKELLFYERQKEIITELEKLERKDEK